MSKIEIVIHKLNNKTDDAWDNCINRVRDRYQNQVNDGSYDVSVSKGETTSERYLYNNYTIFVENPGESIFLDAWQSYVDEHLNRGKWKIHGLVIDFFDMDIYDLGAGGLAVPGSAARSDGAAFWASNARGTVHEASHTMMDPEHWHHNMGRKEGGNATAMGVKQDKGCSHLENVCQPAISSGTTKLGVNTVTGIRAYRDSETYADLNKSCCYNDCSKP